MQTVTVDQPKRRFHLKHSRSHEVVTKETPEFTMRFKKGMSRDKHSLSLQANY